MRTSTDWIDEMEAVVMIFFISASAGFLTGFIAMTILGFASSDSWAIAFTKPFGVVALFFATMTLLSAVVITVFYARSFA